MYGDHLCIKSIYSNSDTEITEKKLLRIQDHKWLIKLIIFKCHSFLTYFFFKCIFKLNYKCKTFHLQYQIHPPGGGVPSFVHISLWTTICPLK